MKGEQRRKECVYGQERVRKRGEDEQEREEKFGRERGE